MTNLDETTATTESDPEPQGDTPQRWLRITLVAGAVFAVLLLGASLGLLIQLPDRELATPDADSVDVGFCQDMSVHHEQAVWMASVARDTTTDPVIRSLAYDIESTQRAQIGRMAGYLSLWNAASQPTGEPMEWMAGAGHGGHGGHGGGTRPDGTEWPSGMPGMASDAELAELEQARGRHFDILFLQLMLRHHQGGVPMAEAGAQRAETAQVRNLAQQILNSQTRESQYMATLLAERGAEPLPPPV